MKRFLSALGLAAALIALAVAAVWLATVVAWTRAGRQPWPADLGTLEAFEARFPPHGTSAAAARLQQLALPLGVEFTPKKRSRIDLAVRDYMRTQLEQPVLEIGEAPPRVVALLARQEPQLDAIRDHLLRGGEIAWPVDLSKAFDAPAPNLLAHLHVTWLLLARALLRARTGDGRAWDDLHAVSNLGRGLEARPELISQAIALHIARQVNGIAWKLPLPVPEWFAATRAVDHRRLMLRGMQYDTWLLWRWGHTAEDAPFGAAGRPYARAGAANLAVHQRETAAILYGWRRCAPAAGWFKERVEVVPRWNVIGRVAVPNLASTWLRVARYAAEQEATDNALRIRAGAAIRTASACTDGAWTEEGGTLSFARDIPRAGEKESVMPLRLQVSKTEPRGGS